MKKQIQQEKILSKINLTKNELLLVNYAISVMLNSTKELINEKLNQRPIKMQTIRELEITAKNCENVYQKLIFMMKEGDKNVNNSIK